MRPVPCSFAIVAASALLVTACRTSGTHAAASATLAVDPPAAGGVASEASSARGEETDQGPEHDAGEVDEAALAEAANPENGFRISGSLSARYRFRQGEGESDHDLYSVLSVDAGDPERDRVSARVLGRFSADLDGRGDQGSQALFHSLQDTYGDPLQADLYEASVAFERPFDSSLRLRAGRQVDVETPQYAHYDGLRLESKPSDTLRLVAGAYGGVPVRIYDATSLGDRLLGAWLGAAPWTNARARVDWMHVEQQDAGRQLRNDLLGLTLDQRLGPALVLHGRYTRLEERDRDLDLRATWNDAEHELLVQASYYRLLTTQNDLAWEFDPFTATLQEFRPYDQYRVLVSKQVHEHLRLDVGGDLRRLEEGADEGRNNHDWERGYATVVLTELATEGLDLSLTGDAWSSDEQDVRTWGVDLSYDRRKAWRASVGSFYTLYRLDVLDDVERSDVRVWYGRLRRRIGSALSLDLRYDYEDSDVGGFHTLAMGATWHF